MSEKRKLLIGELLQYRYLIKEVYPSGIVSLVSDTWNLWEVLRIIAPSLKNDIMSRDGKVVFRPDSGDPVKIVCGYKVKYTPNPSETILQMMEHRTNHEELFNGNDAVQTSDDKFFDMHGRELTPDEVKGVVEILWEEFGGQVNEKGYKVLDSHVGAIYGDSITYERCERICKELAEKGFSSENLVYGIGSFTYQYNTRDTFSIACKATWVTINGVEYNIFKDPVTDSGIKKSAKGLLSVVEQDGELVMLEECTREQEESGLLEVVFEDGVLVKDQTFRDIKERLN